MICMINAAKEGLEYILHHNNATREQERVRTTHKYIEISSDSLSSLSSDDSLETSSDDSSDSGTSQKPTKPVTPSNKSSTFPAKPKSDNEDTPFRQPHQDTFTSKQEFLERIKQLHIKCGFLDTEILSMLTINWSNHHEVTDVNVEIAQNFYNAYCRPIFLLRKILIFGIPKSTVLVIIFRVFTWPILLMNAGP